MTTGKNPKTEFIDHMFNLMQDKRKLTIIPPFRNYGKVTIKKVLDKFWQKIIKG